MDVTGSIGAKNPLRLGLMLAGITFVADQVTKWGMMNLVMDPPRLIPVTPFFNLVVAWNRGVSFGMFSSHSAYSGWILSAIAFIIVGFLVRWLTRITVRHQAAAIGLIVGGALGNVLDRMVHGAVYDFLDLHVAGYHWPAFNVADSGICVGAAILVLDSLFAKSENDDSNESTTDTTEQS